MRSPSEPPPTGDPRQRCLISQPSGGALRAALRGSSGPQPWVTLVRSGFSTASGSRVTSPGLRAIAIGAVAGGLFGGEASTSRSAPSSAADVTREEIVAALTAVGAVLHAREGSWGELYVVGGAAIALALDARRSTGGDVDAVFEPKAEIYEAAARVAGSRWICTPGLRRRKQGLPYAGPNDPEAAPVLDVPGLRCLAASPRMLLALRGSWHTRVGEDDEGALRLLARVLERVEEREAVLAGAEAVFGDRLDTAARLTSSRSCSRMADKPGAPALARCMCEPCRRGPRRLPAVAASSMIVAFLLPLAGAVVAIVRGSRRASAKRGCGLAPPRCWAPASSGSSSSRRFETKKLCRIARKFFVSIHRHVRSPRRRRAWRRARGAGAHQLRSPSSFISEGTRRARTIVASIRTARAVPMPTSLTKMISRSRRADGDHEQQRGGGDDAAGALQADRDGLVVLRAGVERLLDAREQEDAVVRGQAERDRQQHERLRDLQRALRLVAQQRLEPAVLEDEHEQAERRAEAEHVHQQGLQRQHDRAVIANRITSVVGASRQRASGSRPPNASS